jgi:hypothetical protein
MNEHPISAGSPKAFGPIASDRSNLPKAGPGSSKENRFANALDSNQENSTKLSPSFTECNISIVSPKQLTGM